MRYLIGVVAFGLMVGAAAWAGNISPALPSAPGTGHGSGGIANNEYQIDDGSSENSVGLTAGGNLAWLNQFNVTGGNRLITGISLTWGTPSFPGSSGVVPGVTTFKVYVWRDGTANDVNPSDAVLLGTANGTVAAGTVDTDVFQTVSLGAGVSIPAGFNSFYIGASINQNAGTFPASLDQTVSQGRSWVCGSGTQGGFDPNNLNGGIGLFQMDSIGLPGNWMLRANAIPEPATLSLFGLAALGLLRRRR